MSLLTEYQAAVSSGAAAMWELVQARGPELGTALRDAERIELGCAGHLIVADSCQWKRHTQVGKYRVSSIGDYYPQCGDKRDTIGAGKESFFETLVFETTGEQDAENEGCGCRTIKAWGEIDGERYATAGAAQEGHERYVAKYARAPVSEKED